MHDILDIHDLQFSYETHPDARPILDGLDLTVARGSFTALIGINGAGKSTLMNLILGNLKPARGSIKLFGDDQSRNNHYKDLAYVSQNSILAYKNFPTTLEEVVRIHLKHLKKQADVTELLDTVGLTEHFNKKLSQLSGGQLQRVGLLLALIKDAQLILLDEPTSGIDKAFSRELYRILKTLTQQGKTVLLITHHLSDALEFVDKVVQLADGRCKQVQPEAVRCDMGVC